MSSALTLAGIILAATCLQMNTDQDDLVSERLPYHKRYKEYLKEFGDLEYIYAVVETGNNLPRAKAFAKELAGKLAVLPDVSEVTYQISNPKLEKSFLLYLPEEQIRTVGEFLPKMEKINSLAGVFGMMNGIMASPLSREVRQLETGFKFLDNLLDGIIGSAKDDSAYTSFMQQAFFGGDRAYDEDGFLLSENGKLLFVMIMPEKNYKTLSVIDGPLKKIREALNETREKFPGVKAGLTGRPVLSADEMGSSNADMTIATIAALLIVMLIFIVYFRRPLRPAMAVTALIFGIAQTFGIATIFVGHLNILSIVFAVVLVGAGIEFGLQIVSRYREEIAEHKNVRAAIETCIIHTGRGNLTAALTTAAAFFASCLTNFLALQELGFIAGMGILLCLANMFTVLPALMFIHDRNKRPERLDTTLRISLKKFDSLYHKPKLVIAIATIITAAGVIGIFRIGFNHNLLDLQAGGLESVKYEKKIIEDSSQSTWYVPFAASSLEESNLLAEKLKTLPSVGKIETISDVVPELQKEKIEIIANLRLKAPKTGNVNKSETFNAAKLSSELVIFKKNITHLMDEAFSAGETEAVLDLTAVDKKVDEAIQLITGHEPRLEIYEAAFLADLGRQLTMLKSGLEPEPITIKDMPQSIQRRYVSSTSGRFALYAYPKEDIWDPAKMKTFIKDVRTIDRNVTGTPVEVYESGRLLEKSFRQAALFSLLAIILIVAFDFRNLRLAIMALMPLGLGIFWLFELMGIFGIKFNLANFFGIPILLGVGVDNAVQIVHRYLKDGHKHDIGFMTRSTGLAVLLTSLTTIASFGTLVFARHKGIASLGAIISLGTITCFIGSMIILPCVLKVFGKKALTNI